MKKIILIGSLVIMHLVTSLINFEAMAWGNPVSYPNVLATSSYLLFWLFFLTKSKKFENKKVLTYSISFWILILLISASMLIAHLYDIVEVGITIILTVLMMIPLYGLKIITASYQTLSIIYILISLCYITYGAYCLKSSKE